VVFDRRFAPPELLADLGVGEAATKQQHDLSLERREVIGVAEAAILARVVLTHVVSV
jgi:hypothetical protein